MTDLLSLAGSSNATVILSGSSNATVILFLLKLFPYSLCCSYSRLDLVLKTETRAIINHFMQGFCK